MFVYVLFQEIFVLLRMGLEGCVLKAESGEDTLQNKMCMYCHLYVQVCMSVSLPMTRSELFDHGQIIFHFWSLCFKTFFAGKMEAMD